MVRKVCKDLEYQSDNVVRGRSMAGAKINQIANVVGELKGDAKRHLVIMTGTNNIQEDDCRGIVSGYRMLLDRAKEVENRNITVVGILRRFDTTETVERKRSLVNMRLRELCKAKQVEFINLDVQPSMLESDGVHLNLKGREFVGRKFMKHCLYFLD